MPKSPKTFEELKESGELIEIRWYGGEVGRRSAYIRADAEMFEGKPSVSEWVDRYAVPGFSDILGDLVS